MTEFLVGIRAHAKAIQERIGHSSIAVTLDRNGHLLPSVGERIAAGLMAYRTRRRGAKAK